MFFREAKIEDISKIHTIRISVQENQLSDPTRITPEDYTQMLTDRGKGWVCEVEGDILGFAIVDLQESIVWALFVLPEQEGNFIGRMLHDMMVSWCFSRGMAKLTLTTAPETRAERFYMKSGWQKIGVTETGEVRLELENNLDELIAPEQN
ncbi:MAG: GNAT family N-acetyltransferase [Adhaeribacter sp.]